MGTPKMVEYDRPFSTGGEHIKSCLETSSQTTR